MCYQVQALLWRTFPAVLGWQLTAQRGSVQTQSVQFSFSSAGCWEHSLCLSTAITLSFFQPVLWQQCFKGPVPLFCVGSMFLCSVELKWTFSLKSWALGSACRSCGFMQSLYLHGWYQHTHKHTHMILSWPWGGNPGTPLPCSLQPFCWYKQKVCMVPVWLPGASLSLGLYSAKAVLKFLYQRFCTFCWCVCIHSKQCRLPVTLLGMCWHCIHGKSNPCMSLMIVTFMLWVYIISISSL